jgi:hypothetical protein
MSDLAYGAWMFGVTLVFGFVMGFILGLFL